MVEIAGGVTLLLGGLSMAASSISLARHARRPIDRARQLVGNSDDAVVTDLPREMQQLLDQLR